METTTLPSDLRKNLRKLLQGYVEHCEFSNHLTGRIEFPLYYHGFKFGAPVFTHLTPSTRADERPIVGMIGWNTPSSQVPSQILLQFIEILTQHPRLAADSILRILPVANPVALELGPDAPSRDEWDLLGRLADQFKEQAADGWIEVETADVANLTLSGQATPDLYHALEFLEAVPAFHRRTGIRFPKEVDVIPVPEDGSWRLRVQVPGDWTAAEDIHATARFIARLIHERSKTSAAVVSRDF